MLSDEWLSRYELLENLNIKPCGSLTGTRTRTRTRTTGVTAIALLVLLKGELKTKIHVYNDLKLASEMLQLSTDNVITGQVPV